MNYFLTFAWICKSADVSALWTILPTEFVPPTIVTAPVGFLPGFVQRNWWWSKEHGRRFQCGRQVNKPSSTTTTMDTNVYPISDTHTHTDVYIHFFQAITCTVLCVYVLPDRHFRCSRPLIDHFVMKWWKCTDTYTYSHTPTYIHTYICSRVTSSLKMLSFSITRKHRHH